MRMTIVGKNPRSGGSECIVFGHFDRKSDAFAPVAPDIIGQESRTGGLAAYGGWELREMRPGGGEASAPALVGWTPGNDYCRTTGRLVVLSHRWSGRLQIDDIGRRYTVDLYSPETRLALLDLVNEVMLDITPLAGAAKGALALPRLTAEAVIAHLGGGAVWFRFLERDADYDRGPLRRALELLRPRPGEKMKLRVLSALLPLLAARPAPAVLPAPSQPAAPAAEEATRLRDELRLLAAAVEGLALRDAARA